MDPLDREIEAVTAMLRARGARVDFDMGAPDEVKRAWLRMIMESPECWGATEGGKPYEKTH